MLVTTTETQIGTARMKSTLVLERAVRGTIVLRDQLAFDTRYAAAAAGRPDPVGHLFLLVSGRLVADNGNAVEGPVGIVLADDEIERIGKKSRTFRTDGERVHVIQLRFANTTLRVPIGLGSGPLVLPPTCWDAAVAVCREPAALGLLLDGLTAAGVIGSGVVVQPEEPERFRRLWSALGPLYATYGGSTSLKQLANSLEMSMRQVGRDAKELASTFGFGSGYRDSLLVLRLRVAALLLSAAEATVADVAAAVGYGSPIAMARAFRDAKLPSPSAIQAAMRGEYNATPRGS